MGELESATPRLSFRLGFLLLGVFPTDILTSIAVGTRLARENSPWWHALLFILVTLLLLALPAIALLLLGERARRALPTIRDWMNTNSWVVSEVVIAFFIIIEINSLTS